MFLNNAIHQYIKEIGLHPLAKIGADLVKQGMLSKPLHHASLKAIFFIVEDEFQLTIKYKNAFALDSVFCNCGQPAPCEHVFGGLYFLLESEDVALQDTRDVPSGFFVPGLHENPGEKDDQNVYPLNEYRILPVKDVHAYIEFLNVYKPPFLRNFTSLVLENIVLTEKGHLEFRISEKHYFQEGKSDLIHKVDIQQSDEEFSIKCQTCKESSVSMCIHQYEVMKHQDVKAILLFGNMPDYDQEIQYWSKKYSIVPSKFVQLYEIHLEGQQTKAVLVNLQFFTQQKMGALQKQIGDQILSHKQRLAGVAQEDPDGVNGHAVLWTLDGKNETVSLLSGKMDKLGNELTSKIEKTQNPEYLSGFEKDLWYRIERFSKENVHDNAVYKDAAWNRFLKHLVGDINALHHFVPMSKGEQLILSKRNIRQINFSSYAVDALVRVVKEEAFYKIKLWLKIKDDLIDPLLQPLTLTPYFLVVQQEAHIFKHPELGRLFTLLGWEEILVDTEHHSSLQSLLHDIHNVVEVDYPEDMKPNFVYVENPHWKIYVRENGHHLLFTPILEYGETLEVSLPLDKWIVQKPGSDVLYTIPEEDEEKFVLFIKEQHEQFEQNLFHHGMFFLHYKDYLNENWFLHFFEKCREAGITILGQDELENFKMNTYKPSIRLGISSGIDWFDVQVDISYGDQMVSAKSWMEALRKNEKYILLADGSLGLIPEEWYDKLKRLSMVAYEEKGKVKLNSYHFNIVESLFSEIEDDELYRDIKRKISVLGNYDFSKEHPLPENGQIALRDYQKLGFQWLKSLSDLGFGGCLADDMGLGKTLQVLTLLSDQKLAGKKTSLIVVPRSLLFNWAQEIVKFYPDITYLYYHGIDRSSLRSKLFQYDIVISTYDTVTNDIEFLKEHTFNYIILDESQAIKNPESKRYKAMRLLKSANKIAITGTPIENNTFDLYAQFSFVNPGIFGSASQFKTNFAIPIDRESDRESAYILKKIIHPFLLRRTKAQVASDLPERSESILYCEMGETQRKMYEDFRLKIKSEIDEGVKNIGINKMRIKVIEGLLRLRQICNSPQLLDQNLPNHLRQSVKIETLMDIIENDMGDHHALIYSQFTSMLALVRYELDRKGIPYAYLDGSTRDRQGAVRDFMENKEVKLFLISLKAGNTGLNLVKADYVYILDPWWNPAVEAQAIDRTHRIGQDKNVFAYKMICRDTIEEKIILLQEKKKQLATDLIITDEQIYKSLNNDDLISLFN